MLIRRRGESGWRDPATTAYMDEAELQRLIEETPTLLPGVDTTTAAVATEVNLGSAGFVDVLVVEPSGDITLVECKLRANPEIRRHVVGQMLAYAASAWRMSYAEFDAAFARRANASLAAALGDRVGDWDEERFRQTVTSNLQDGVLRLVIAVDEITAELKQIVTFLNRHTSPAIELLAIELRRAVDDGVEVLLPQIYGEESANEKTESRRGALASEAEVLRTIRERHPDAAGERMVALYEFMRDRGARLSWGRGGRDPSVTTWLGEDVGNPVSVGFYPYGVVVNFGFLVDRRSDAEMARLADLVRAIPGAAPHYERLEHVGFRMRPTLSPDVVLADDAALEAFKRAIAEAIRPPLR